MNTQTKIIAPALALPSRFDLRGTGLSDAQLKSIAGARPCGNTCRATAVPITKCCQ